MFVERVIMSAGSKKINDGMLLCAKERKFVDAIFIGINEA